MLCVSQLAPKDKTRLFTAGVPRDTPALKTVEFLLVNPARLG